jgi:hypothetical protein
LAGKKVRETLTGNTVGQINWQLIYTHDYLSVPSIYYPDDLTLQRRVSEFMPRKED